MVKVRKLWKIERRYNANLRYHDDWKFHSFEKSFSTKLEEILYPTELDCLLDAVTEPLYTGMKVYKHQTVEEYLQGDYRGRWTWFFNPNRSFLGTEIMYVSEEEYLKDPNKYVTLSGEKVLEFEDYYDMFIHHYVEVFMQ